MYKCTEIRKKLLKEEGHSFEDSNVHILDIEDIWFERGVNDVIHP